MAPEPRAGRDQGHHGHQRGCEPATGSRRRADQRHRQRRYPRNYDQERNDHGHRDGDVAVFLGNGNDTFGSEMDTPFNSEAAAMVTGDFNNDDALDVVVGGPVTTDSGGNPASGASLSRGEGQRLIRRAHANRHAAQSGLIRRRQLTSAKNLDLVVANGGTPFATTPVDGSVLVYLGNGNETSSRRRRCRRRLFRRPWRSPTLMTTAIPTSSCCRNSAARASKAAYGCSWAMARATSAPGSRPRSTNTPTACRSETSTATVFPTSRSRVAAALPTPKCGPAMATELHRSH